MTSNGKLALLILALKQFQVAEFSHWASPKCFMHSTSRERCELHIFYLVFFFILCLWNSTKKWNNFSFALCDLQWFQELILHAFFAFVGLKLASDRVCDFRCRFKSMRVWCLVCLIPILVQSEKRSENVGDSLWRRKIGKKYNNKFSRLRWMLGWSSWRQGYIVTIWGSGKEPKMVSPLAACKLNFVVAKRNIEK